MSKYNSSFLWQKLHKLTSFALKSPVRIFITLSVLIFLFFVGSNVFSLGVSLVHWKAYTWAASYAVSDKGEIAPDSDKHLIFVMVDHYEHGKGEAAAKRNLEWCEAFSEISDRNVDSYGNKFRYTWFYPYDHANEMVMAELSRMAYLGYGEVEMHWHLSSRSGVCNDTYDDRLDEAIQWYQQFGAMITSEPSPRTAFAYVAGNWDLDAANSVTSHGVTNQIQTLNEKGCYADFTYSTIDTDAQPAKVNSLYYVTDNPAEAKSHNTGVDAKVGHMVDDKLLIFQGPCSIKWNGALEYGAIESSPRFRPERIQSWVDANIHVAGRPEWIFVKVYSHGAQSADIVLHNDMEIMLKELKKYCDARGIRLHYMSSREAYNVVKAAESGMKGNPESYRDYAIGKYLNMVQLMPFTMNVLN